MKNWKKNINWKNCFKENARKRDRRKKICIQLNWVIKLKEKIYNRQKCLEYANQWALSRNPAYYDYEKIGGDCTNFASQCIFAGSGVMNYNSWYYKNGNNKSPSWTGVEFLYNFLVNNKGVGPHGMEVLQNQIQVGDLVQLSSNGQRFTHSLIIVDIGNVNYLSDILIATHTYDALRRPLVTYDFEKIRFVHIDKIYE